MKRTLVILALVTILLAFSVSCDNGGLSFPDFVLETILNAEPDVLIGVGTANSSTISASRAKAEIARQMNTMTSYMLQDYQASNTVDPLTAVLFQEEMIGELSKSPLTYSFIKDMRIGKNKKVWAVAFFEKTDVAEELKKAESAAKSAVPGMDSFSVDDFMDDAFDIVNTEERLKLLHD